MRKGGGEGEGDEGVREVGLLEKDDGDGERAGDMAEEVEFRGGGREREGIEEGLGAL